MDNEDAELQVPLGFVTGVNFDIVTEEDAEKISVKAIESGSDVTHPMLGIPNPTSPQCLTCDATDYKTCEGHFGLIKFPFTILHPYFIADVAKVLNRICPGCKSIRHRVKKSGQRSTQLRPGTCKYCDWRSKDIYPRMTFKVSTKEIFGRTAIFAQVNEQLWMESRSIAKDYWDFIPDDPQQEKSSQPYKRVLSHVQVYDLLKDVDLSFLQEFAHGKKDVMFLNSFPITPNSHRVNEFGGHVRFDARTAAYRKLVDFRGSPNELSTRVLDCLKMSKLRSDKSEKTNMFVPNEESAGPKMSGLKYMKDVLLGKRSDHAFRMVVVGDPNIKVDEIGVPSNIAEVMQISERLNSRNWENLGVRILAKGWTFIRREGGLVRVCLKNDKLHIGDTIFRPLCDGDIVLMNRPPSIHPHSLIALYVKILPVNSVLSLNPLICSPFRGDFDGDCFHGYIPQSVNSRVELNELVALDKQLINVQSGQNLLSLSHDSLTAAQLVIEDDVLLNRFQMQQLQMFCYCPRQLELPAVVKAIPPNNSCLWTGKQLFSLLLPKDFNYDFSANGVHISKGELLSCSGASSWLRDSEGNLLDSLVKHHKREFLDFLHAAQGVFCEWLSMRGLSVSLADLYLVYDSQSRENMMDEVFHGLREAERISHIKLLMGDSNRDFLIGDFQESELANNFGAEHTFYERQKSAVLSQVSASAFKQVFKDIQNLFYHYASEDNSFLAMLKAGSKKSNVTKLVQHGMCLGLQHSSVPLSFRIPSQLSCDVWNSQKTLDSLPGHSMKSYIPYAVVESSFLTGLNPLECFVHSLTTRDSSFGGHADISGTLTRRIMFFMRDLCVEYDGTVRNAYGNQVVQFKYDVKDHIGPDGSIKDAMGGQPVGSWAACAISEAAYSALDQPISALESSPLLNLKEILECGGNKRGDITASLFLSKKLGKWTHGFEYGALEVKSHLERLRFLDIVSTVKIMFSPKNSSHKNISPWVCHFHISKDTVKSKQIKVQSIIDALCVKCNSTRLKSKVNLPNLQITSKYCSEENNGIICITASIVGSSKNSNLQLDTLKDPVIPFLLGTIIKGSSNVEKVDILWKDPPNVETSCKSLSGELYLRVCMSETCDRMIFWGALMDDCLPLMDMIDWERSHPEDIRDLTLTLGIDVAKKQFLSKLESAISDTGKDILPEHLNLVADCLSSTGEFVPFSANGLARQRKHISVSSPFMQACFSSPADCFVNAAKMGIQDDLQGSLDALSWGNTPSLGTGGKFDIVYSGKGHEVDKPEDIYSLLGSHVNAHEPKVKLPDERNNMSIKSLTKEKEVLRKNFSAANFMWMSRKLRHILYKYDIDQQLSDFDEKFVTAALYFHPRSSEKIGSGLQETKIGLNSKHGNSRCFVLVRTDGTVEDFSYHKCIHRALELIAPKSATEYQSKWLDRRN